MPHEFKPPSDFPKSGFVRGPAVRAFVGVGNTKLHEMVKTGEFVQPVRLSRRCTVWSAEEVRAWVNARLAERQQSRELEAA